MLAEGVVVLFAPHLVASVLQVPPLLAQHLRIDYARLPALPRSRFVIRNVKERA